jgi:hypothetical protein
MAEKPRTIEKAAQHVEWAIESAAGDAARALRTLIGDAQRALAGIEEGTAHRATDAALGRTSVAVERHTGRLVTLTGVAYAVGIDPVAIVKAGAER